MLQKWKVICRNRAEQQCFCLLATFSHLAVVASVLVMLCFALLYYSPIPLYHFYDDTTCSTAQTVSKIMCRLPNKEQLPTLSLSLAVSLFRTLIFGPFPVWVFPPQQRWQENIKKNHATPIWYFSFRIKLPALRLTKEKKCNTTVFYVIW